MAWPGGGPGGGPGAGRGRLGESLEPCTGRGPDGRPGPPGTGRRPGCGGLGCRRGIGDEGGGPVGPAGGFLASESARLRLGRDSCAGARTRPLPCCRIHLLGSGWSDRGSARPPVTPLTGQSRCSSRRRDSSPSPAGPQDSDGSPVGARRTAFKLPRPARPARPAVRAGPDGPAGSVGVHGSRSEFPAGIPVARPTGGFGRGARPGAPVVLLRTVSESVPPP